MADITRNTLAAAIREARNFNREYLARYAAAGYGTTATDERARIKAANMEARDKAINEVLPPYALGYCDMAYYPMGEYDLIGDVLCADCARAYIKADHDARLCAESTDGYEGNDSADHLCCDDCYRIICRAWLRPAGHRDDRDLSWSHLRWLRAEDSGVALDSPARYRARHWTGKRRTRQFARRYATRVATLAIWRWRNLTDRSYVWRSNHGLSGLR